MRSLLILITKIMAAVMPQSSIIKIFTILVRDVAKRRFGQRNNKKDILKLKKGIFTTNQSGAMNAIPSECRINITNNKLMHNTSLQRISLHGFAVP